MFRKGLKITAAIVGIMALGILGLYTYDRLNFWIEQKNSPYSKPGTVWTDSVVALGYGTDLILLHDGTYASTNVCDICLGGDFNWGTWLDTGSQIILAPSEKPQSIYILVKESRGGCSFLRDDSPDITHHPTFVNSSSDICKKLRREELYGKIPLAQLTEQGPNNSFKPMPLRGTA